MENKYIIQAKKGKTQAWRYVSGILLILLACGLFTIPYSWVLNAKIANGQADVTKMSDMNYLSTLLDSNSTLVYMMLPFVGGMFALYMVVTKLHQLPWKYITTSRASIDFKRIAFSFLLWGGISALVILIGVLSNPTEVVWNFKFSKFVCLFVIALALIPIQTSFEEYVFRGYLLQGLGVASNTNWFPLATTSITFGLMHFTNPEVLQLGYGIMVFYIGTGLLLGVITLMDEGIELSLGFHAANNLITALLVTADWTAFKTHALFKDSTQPNLAVELLIIAILYPLLLLVFAKKYQWKNWKEKLL